MAVLRLITDFGVDPIAPLRLRSLSRKFPRYPTVAILFALSSISGVHAAITANVRQVLLDLYGSTNGAGCWLKVCVADNDCKGIPGS